jgi:hypothetical protein
MHENFNHIFLNS